MVFWVPPEPRALIAMRAAQIPPSPWHSPDYPPEGLDAALLCEIMAEDLKARRWTVRTWPKFLRRFSWTERKSMTWSVWRTVYLRTTYTGQTDFDAALLDHERTHTLQQSRWWILQQWWGIKYLLLKLFRTSVEIEAESTEAATLARLGSRAGDLRDQLDETRLPRTAGWTTRSLMTAVRQRSLEKRS